MGQGLCRKKKLWSKVGRAELEALPLGLWASRRRKELLELLDHLERPIAELQQEAIQQAEAHPSAARLILWRRRGHLVGAGIRRCDVRRRRWQRSLS